MDGDEMMKEEEVKMEVEADGEDATIGRDPLCNSPPPSSSSLSQPTTPTSATGHRSRKEKLVVRSFSTEIDEIQPKILSHAEFFGSPTPGKRRTRRTASAPVASTSKARSREHSPSVDGEGSDEEDESDVGTDSTASSGLNEGGGDPLTSNPVRKYRRRKEKKMKEEAAGEEEEDEFVDVDDDVEVGKKGRKKIAGKKSGRTRRGSGSQGGRGRKTPKTPSDLDSPVKERKRRSQTPREKKAPSSPQLKTSPKYTRQLAKLQLMHAKAALDKAKTSPVGSPKQKVRFQDPLTSSVSKNRVVTGGNLTAKSSTVGPKPQRSSSSSLVSVPPPTAAAAVPPAPAPPLPRRLIHYKVPDKFQSIMDRSQEKKIEVDSYIESLIKTRSELAAQLEAVQSSTNKYKSSCKKIPELLAPPPPPAAASSPFTPPQPPSQQVVALSTEVSRPYLEDSDDDKVVSFPKEQHELNYAHGYNVLSELMSSYTREDDGDEQQSILRRSVGSSSNLSFTMPDVCRETVAQLSSLVAKCSVKSKRKEKPPRDADKDDGSTSDCSSEEDYSPFFQPTYPESSSIPKMESYIRKVLRKSSRTQEISHLHASPRQEGEFNPNFVMGSYIGPDEETGRRPRVTAQELETFKELMEPSDTFMLYDDEQEMINLWCELMRDELRAIKEEREMKGELEDLLMDAAEGAEGKKIVDAYPIFVKPEHKHCFLEGSLMSQEAFIKHVTKGKENQRKELATRRLRSGKTVPLKKIYIPEWKKKVAAPPATSGLSNNRSEESGKKAAPSAPAAAASSASALSTATCGPAGRLMTVGGRRIRIPIRRTKKIPAAATLPMIKPDCLTPSSPLKVLKGMSPPSSRMMLRDGTEVSPATSSSNSSSPGGSGSDSMCQVEIPATLRGGTARSVGMEDNTTTGSPPKADEYSQRVEASLRRLEAGTAFSREDVDISYIDQGWSSPPTSVASSSSSTSRCRTQPLGGARGMLGSNQSYGPASPSTSAWAASISTVLTPPPQSSSSDGGIFNFSGIATGFSGDQATDGLPSTPPNMMSSGGAGGGGYLPGPSSSSSLYFKPIQTYPFGSNSQQGHVFDNYLRRNPATMQYQLGGSPLSSPYNGGSNANLRSGPFSGAMMSGINSPMIGTCSPMDSTKTRYSRLRHATLCPPFDNNNCSYNFHNCTYPRAPNSRFCIHHVDEGATVNFERCIYVKGTRECGAFVPRSSSQGLFCDPHSLAIANAHMKKTRPVKTMDKTEGLLKHLRCNLDRSEGKIMEHGHGSYSVRKDFIEDEFDTLNNSSDTDESDDESSVERMCKAQRGDDDSDVDDTDPNVPDYGALKNAGHFTVEECVKMSQRALEEQRKCMLQEMELVKRKFSLGYRQYQQGIQALRSKRVNFTTDPKFLSTNMSGLTPQQIQREVKVHNETTAMMSHRRISGQRCLLRHEVLRRRQAIFEAARPPGPASAGIEFSRWPIHPAETKEEIHLRLRRAKKGKPVLCSFGSGHEKCGEKAVQLARFCWKHIAMDKSQHLFTTCGFRLGPDTDDVCTTPVFSEIEKFGCPLHALPIPLKDPPESQNKKAKVEEEIDKLMEEPGMDSSGDEEEEDESSGGGGDGGEEDGADRHDESMVREMEHLVGDELVDADHFKETLASIYARGMYETDSEESEDTEEEDENGGGGGGGQQQDGGGGDAGGGGAGGMEL
ncbi:serine/arginine repetitive matrix protein 2 isoform X2 [Folsomia candida]|uniref:serine/arginine repetitive matrix protein 2 isoform X2 n=1 Tax=Folsomia candida TaxID=158441 RepID=UPI0016053D99|nr:serine/arginine repetitive matrix protein 2 isoform X2 [Folsomia candida]